MNRMETERLAGAVNKLRPDWPWASLVTFIETHLVEHAYQDAAVALAYIATDATTRTPKRVLESGPWWPTRTSSPRAEPGIITYCDHGEPGSSCPACYPRRLGGSGVGPTPEQRAAMRAAMRGDLDA
ncbi:MAG: hypothetical protein QM708_12145 [Propioniciclava sp.]|uniref:hypothetical protein n=1 Tax=Propioniciclava sp. TaxID=2038686 RepID=UPI0039E4966C